MDQEIQVRKVGESGTGECSVDLFAGKNISELRVNGFFSNCPQVGMQQSASGMFVNAKWSAPYDAAAGQGAVESGFLLNDTHKYPLN